MNSLTQEEIEIQDLCLQNFQEATRSFAETRDYTDALAGLSALAFLTMLHGSKSAALSITRDPKAVDQMLVAVRGADIDTIVAELLDYAEEAPEGLHDELSVVVTGLSFADRKDAVAACKDIFSSSNNRPARDVLEQSIGVLLSVRSTDYADYYTWVTEENGLA